MPTIFVIVFLAIFALCKPIKPKLIIATLAGCVLIALIQGPLYYTLTTRSSEEEPAISAAQHLAIDGIQSVVYFGGNLAPETEAYLESFAPIEYWKSTYAIYKIDLWKWPSSFDSVRAKHTNTLIEHYLKTLVREPFLLIQNRLNNADLMWDIAQPKGMYVQRLSISHDIIEEYDFQLKFPRHENILTTIAKIANSVTIAIPLTDILLYRAGAHIIFSMLFCVYLCAHKMRKYMAAFIPMFGSILALLIAMGWPDFRVVWFIFVISTFVAPYLLSCKKHG
ncbi:hypothetical protein AGMMS50276_23700 [Synergistales bacterium]|nr:hypothetical protein AGMMS50276_23700 [Synergistales bacterium]